MERLRVKTNLQSLEADGKTAFRVFGNYDLPEGADYNNTITIFTSIAAAKKKQRVQSAAGAAMQPLLQVQRIVCNFTFIVVGTIQPVLRAASGAPAGGAAISGSAGTGNKGPIGSGKVLEVYKQGAPVGTAPALVAISAANTSSASGIRIAFHGTNEELQCNLREATFNELVMADMQVWSASADEIPKYFSLRTIGVVKHPTTQRSYFVLLDNCINMETGRSEPITETKLLLIAEALTQGLGNNSRCVLQTYPSLPRRNMRDAREVFEMTGQAVRTYYNSSPGNPLFAEALHTLAAASLQALAHDDLIKTFGCVAIMNIYSVQPERGKTLICSLLQAFFGWKNAALQDTTQSSTIDIVDIVSGIPVVLDDLRGENEHEMEEITHMCYNAQPTATMIRGTRKCHTKLVVATNVPWMGLTVTKPQHGATFTRVTPVRFDLPSGGAVRPKLFNSAPVAALLGKAPVVFFKLLELVQTLKDQLEQNVEVRCACAFTCYLIVIQYFGRS